MTAFDDSKGLRRSLRDAGVGARGRAGRLRAWLRARPRLLTGALLAALALASLFAGLAIGSWRGVCRGDCPSIAQIYVWEPKSATRILDRNRQLIAELFFQERRTPIDITTLPDYVPQAFIAVEDKRFYRHKGFDPVRLVGANVRNVLSGEITGGGSTVTQQLARWMFSEEIGFEVNAPRVIDRSLVTRKLKELKVAIELESVYSKDQILEAYINQVNYGDGRHGIEAASQYFFGKPAVRLDPAEAALLAAVINRPSTYSPFRHPDRARQRRNMVLRLMAEQGYLGTTEMREWQNAPLPAEPFRSGEDRTAPYFVEWVRTILDDRFGSDLYSKGFQVVTTLDLETQRQAQIAMDSGWARIEAAPGYGGAKYADVIADEDREITNETPYIQGAFIALDPHTGEVRALIGGRDFEDSKFNRATQALRQPGSTFKPFVYAAAIASGVPASHVIYDSPVMLELDDSTTYAPENYEPEFRGPLTLRDAIKYSVNTVAVKLGLEVGLETVAQVARQLGVRTPIPVVPSMPIGSADVIPLQLAEAYTPFATTGTLVQSRSILRVEDQDGRVLWETRPERETVLDSLTAAITRDLLRGALDSGTGANARNPALGNLPYEVPAAGKTGTTNDATNVWFAGFTPDLLAVVWFGFDRPRRIASKATGGGFAAPVWGQFMRSIYFASDSTEAPDSTEASDSIDSGIAGPWPWPEGITTRVVDRETGKLAAEWCPRFNTYTEFFIPGTEPTETCGPSGGLFDAPTRGFPFDTIFGDTVPIPGDTIDLRRPINDTLRTDTLRADTSRSGAR